MDKIFDPVDFSRGVEEHFAQMFPGAENKKTIDRIIGSRHTTFKSKSGKNEKNKIADYIYDKSKSFLDYSHKSISTDELLLIYKSINTNDISLVDGLPDFRINNIMGHMLCYIDSIVENKDDVSAVFPQIQHWIMHYTMSTWSKKYDPGEMLFFHPDNFTAVPPRLNNTDRLSKRKKEFILKKINESSSYMNLYKNQIEMIYADNVFNSFYCLSSDANKKCLHETQHLQNSSKTPLDIYLTDRKVSEIADIIIGEIVSLYGSQEERSKKIENGECDIKKVIINGVKSLSPDEGLQNGWSDKKEFISDIDKIVTSTNFFNDGVELMIKGLKGCFRKIIEDVGNIARRESESQDAFNQLLAEYSKDKELKKYPKTNRNKVMPVPITEAVDDSPQLEQVVTVDLIDKQPNNAFNKYKISKRVRRWAIKDIDKIRQFTDGNKRRYLKMTSDDILKRRMFHHLPGTDLFIDNKAYCFNTKTGKGCIVKVYYDGECYDGVLYFAIDKKNIIYHRYVEPLKEFEENVSDIFSHHTTDNKIDTRDPDWETEGLYNVSYVKDGIIQICFPDEDYFIEIYPIRPELL